MLHDVEGHFPDAAQSTEQLHTVRKRIHAASTHVLSTHQVLQPLVVVVKDTSRSKGVAVTSHVLDARLVREVPDRLRWRRQQNYTLDTHSVGCRIVQYNVLHGLIPKHGTDDGLTAGRRFFADQVDDHTRR